MKYVRSYFRDIFGMCGAVSCQDYLRLLRILPNYASSDARIRKENIANMIPSTRYRISIVKYANPKYPLYLLAGISPKKVPA